MSAIGWWQQKQAEEAIAALGRAVAAREAIEASAAIERLKRIGGQELAKEALSQAAREDLMGRSSSAGVNNFWAMTSAMEGAAKSWADVAVIAGLDPALWRLCAEMVSEVSASQGLRERWSDQGSMAEREAARTGGLERLLASAELAWALDKQGARLEGPEAIELARALQPWIGKSKPWSEQVEKGWGWSGQKANEMWSGQKRGEFLSKLRAWIEAAELEAQAERGSERKRSPGL